MTDLFRNNRIISSSAKSSPTYSDVQEFLCLTFDVVVAAEIAMGFFSRKSTSGSNRLADAVAADVAEAFARFSAECGDDSIVALALCTVDDAVAPYIMGATLDDIGPIKGTKDTFNAFPADWSWSDSNSNYRYGPIIDEMLEHQPDSFEEHGRDIFEGIVEGLKKFDATGRFQGKLPRDQMLLLLWINDPAEHNAEAMLNWVDQMNPKPVSKWYKAINPFGE